MQFESSGWARAIVRSRESLTDEDRKNFRTIVGSEVDQLADDLTGAPDPLLRRVFSKEKFINEGRWNELGLHVFRCLAAERLFEVHWRELGLDEIPEHRTFRRDGFLVVPDFLTLREIEIFRRHEELSHRACGRLTELVHACTEIGRFEKGMRIQRVRSTGGVHKQCELHVDTFYAAIKMWYYLDEIRREHGPLHVVAGSHLNVPGKLAWLHETSLIGADPQHPLFFSRFPPDETNGSLRVNVGGDKRSLLEAMGFEEEQPLAFPANTLIVADVSSIHRRGLAAAGVVREAGRAKHRICPLSLLEQGERSLLRAG